MYTCIKKGTKLVWNKGAPIKSAISSTSPKPTDTSNPKNPSTGTKIDQLSLDPRISDTKLLSPIANCKTVDNSPAYGRNGIIHQNGFPRPNEALYPSGKAKILVIPFKYETWPFLTSARSGSNRTLSDLDALKNISAEAEKLVTQLSAGRFGIEIEILPENEWWTMSSKQSLVEGFSPANFELLSKTILENDGKIDFQKYDSYVFVSSISAPIPSVAQATITGNIKTSRGYADKLVLVTSWASSTLFYHELGHSLFGLEHLYLYSEVWGSGGKNLDWLPADLKPITSFDLMGSSDLKAFANWNRFLMNWISDSEVRCITDQQKSTHYLADFTVPNQPKLLLINLAPGVTLAAETREGKDSQNLFTYLIDTNLDNGDGPVRSYNKLVQIGESIEFYDWKMQVIESSKDGLLLEVSKGNGSKYVAPVLQRTSQGGDGTDRPRPRLGEILPTTYLNARARWEVSNYKSYRIFITPFDDPKKILFDTGIVNDSRDPLIVEVSGLICGKELMTTTQFWTERDGKGVKEQSSSGQLGKFECK